ncbi:hypothetical protein GCK32_022395, partial [Trichostrongylus colubriformis]
MIICPVIPPCPCCHGASIRPPPSTRSDNPPYPVASFTPDHHTGKVAIMKTSCSTAKRPTSTATADMIPTSSFPHYTSIPPFMSQTGLPYTSFVFPNSLTNTRATTSANGNNA